MFMLSLYLFIWESVAIWQYLEASRYKNIIYEFWKSGGYIFQDSSAPVFWIVLRIRR